MITDQLTDEEASVRDLCREFAAVEIAPHASRWWEEERCPIEPLPSAWAGSASWGRSSPRRPVARGSRRSGLWRRFTRSPKVDQSIGAAWQAHLSIGTMPLLLSGSSAQQERWLRPLASGQALGSFALTEPDAGSDAAGIRTRATPDGNGEWTLNGSKSFISNAGTAMSLGPVVLARTSQDERRFGAFLIERETPGFSVGPKLRGIGWHALDTRSLSFEDVRLTNEHVIGDPGKGLSQFFSALAVGRMTVATLRIALTAAVLELALDYAKQRRQFGRAISE